MLPQPQSQAFKPSHKPQCIQPQITDQVGQDICPTPGHSSTLQCFHLAWTIHPNFYHLLNPTSDAHVSIAKFIFGQSPISQVPLIHAATPTENPDSHTGTGISCILQDFLYL